MDATRTDPAFPAGEDDRDAHAPGGRPAGGSGRASAAVRIRPVPGEAGPVPASVLRGIASHAARHDREASFPHDSLRLLGRAGLLSLTVPRGFGGQGAGLRHAASVVERVGACCASTALVLAMHLIQQHLAAEGVAGEGGWPLALRRRLGEGAVSEAALVNAFRVEPALGTPARGGLPDTLARRSADGWSLDGRKIYSTGAPGLRWALVYARTDEAAPRVGQFAVAMDGPGVRVEPSWDQLGLRASGSHDVVLDGAPVAADMVAELRPADAQTPPEPGQVAWNTLMVASLYTGVARAGRDWLAAFLRERTPANLGAPLATLPRMHEALGGIDALLLSSHRLLDSWAGDVDEGRVPPAAESGLLKTQVTANAIEAVQRCVALCGNPALSRSAPLERHLRDVLCARIHTPQPDAAFAAAGRAGLGV